MTIVEPVVVLEETGGAFLKLGNFGFGFGAEKNDESDFASLTVVVTTLGFTCATFEVVAVFAAATDGFFGGGAAFDELSSESFRFFVFSIFFDFILC